MRYKIIITILALSGLCLIIGLMPALSECTISGVYQSDWGSVILNDQGQNVSGTWKNGTISGVKDGTVIHYTWYQGSVPGGRGVWQISPDCAQLTGPWGKGNSDSDGGYWNLYK